MPGFVSGAARRYTVPMLTAAIDHPLTEEVKRMAFRLNSAGKAVLDTSWRWDQYYRERCDFNRIWWLRRGVITLRTAQGTCRLSAPRAYFIPAGLPFTASTRRAEKFWIDFNLFVFGAEDLLRFLRRKTVMSFPVGLLPAAAEAHTALAPSLALVATAAGAAHTYVSRYAGSIDLDRLAVFGKYRAVIRHIQENLSLRLSIRQLSAAAGTSDYYLSARFKRDMGMSLKRYIGQALFSESTRRLLAGDEPVKQIAHDLGFASEFYFSNFFKRHGGRSPSAYRRNFMFRS